MDPANQNELIEDLRAQISQLNAKLDEKDQRLDDLLAELQTYQGTKRGPGFEVAKQLYLANAKLTDAINTFLASNQGRHEESLKQVNHWIENVYQVATLKPLRPFVDAIVSLAFRQNENSAKNLDYRINHIGEKLGLTDTDLKSPDLNIQLLVALEQAEAFIEATIINNNTLGLLARAHEFAGHPGVVAYAILAECKSPEGLSLTTVDKLDPAWIKANLYQNPKTERLKRGLEAVWASKHRPKNMTRETFCDEYGIEFETLKLNETWWRALHKVETNPSGLFPYK